MSAAAAVSLLLFFGIGVPLIYLVFKVLVISAEISRRARRTRITLDVARRSDAAVAAVLPLVDDMRRGRSGPDGVGVHLGAANDELRNLAHEADGGLAAEIERAMRAIELVEHGRQLQEGAAHDGRGEGETSIKRGYLNLLHAREAIKTQAELIAAAARKRA